MKIGCDPIAVHHRRACVWNERLCPTEIYTRCISSALLKNWCAFRILDRKREFPNEEIRCIYMFPNTAHQSFSAKLVDILRYHLTLLPPPPFPLPHPPPSPQIGARILSDHLWRNDFGKLAVGTLVNSPHRFRRNKPDKPFCSHSNVWQHHIAISIGNTTQQRFRNVEAPMTSTNGPVV